MDVFDSFLKYQNLAKSLGFYWADSSQIMHQISLELDEVKAELATNNQLALQTELGDVLHACLELITFCKLDVHATMELAVAKIGKRFEAMQIMIAKEGIQDFANLPRATQLLYWERVKRQLQGCESKGSGHEA